MIVDTSALIAIAYREPHAGAMLQALATQASLRISAANMLEAWMVVDRKSDPSAKVILDEMLDRFGITVESITEEHVVVARDAWRRYGRGSGHPAQLNFGDCFAYALAKVTAEPLLYVGNDFTHTDLLLATVGDTR